MNRIAPKIKAVDPMCAIIDPDGGPTMESHRFIGFEIRMTKGEMKRMGYENLEYATQKSMDESRQKEKDAAGIVDAPDATPNRLLDVYVHFTIIDGKKYRVVTNWEINKILSFEYLRPVM